MKLKFEIEIDAARADVWAAFDEPDNLPRWQQNLQTVTLLSGQRGHPGAESEFVYDDGGKTVVLTETITERAAPKFVAGVYSTPSTQTLIVNHFEPAGEAATRWTSWLNVNFTGFMRLRALFMIGAIQQRMEDDMARFKLMVETDAASG